MANSRLTQRLINVLSFGMKPETLDGGFVNACVNRVKREGFHEAVLMSGTNIPAAGADRQFQLFLTLCDAFKANDADIPFFEDTYLLADTYFNQPHGTLMRAIRDNPKSYNKDQAFYDDSKLTILYTQMHKLASLHPAASLTFDFYDNDEAVLTNLQIFLTDNPDLLPGNVRLRLNLYKNGMVHVSEAIVSPNDFIDGEYEKNLLFMHECAKQRDAGGFNITHENMIDNLTFEYHDHRTHDMECGLALFQENKILADVIPPLAIPPANSGQMLQKFKVDIDYFRHSVTHSRLYQNEEGVNIFINALYDMHALLSANVAKQQLRHTADANIKTSSAIVIAYETSALLEFLHEDYSQQEKIERIEQYSVKCLEETGSSGFLKAAAVIAIAGAGMVIGAAAGIVIGMLAGAWTGPGAVMTMLAGMLAGASTGAVKGLVLGSALTGVSAAAASGYLLFRPNKAMRASQIIASCALAVYSTPEVADEHNIELMMPVRAR